MEFSANRWYHVTMDLTTNVQYIPRVGPMKARLLQKLGIFTVRDLLFYIPFRYNDFSTCAKIRTIRPGMTVSISGTLTSMRNFYTKNGKKIQQGQITDETGSLTAIWFNQPFLTKVMKPGDAIALAGTITFFGKLLVILSPEYELLGESASHLHTGRLVPVYSETEGVSSKWLRGRIAFVYESCNKSIVDYVPESIRREFHLAPLDEAIEHVHFPQSSSHAALAKHRLAFDELFLMQLSSYLQKKKWQETKKAPVFSTPHEKVRKFLSGLPFQLTHDQSQSLQAILSDFTRHFPMNRLLEGDVGSGKTVVAAVAMLVAYENGYQSVLLAPTQILAHQHFETISALLSPFGISVELLTGGHSHAKKKKGNSTRHSSVLVGTHALLEKDVHFDNVGFVVIDEQQRFGVKQRSAIRMKGKNLSTPHLLTMTATPIPRTLALTLYGNLDLSILNEMPHGRKIIKTWVVPRHKRIAGYEWIKKQLNETDSQAFIVCPFIEESESMSTVKAATVEYTKLKEHIYPDIPLSLLHGRMKAKEKVNILTEFKNKQTRILVTTPVVEVGIDVPNATVIVIEGADRFGLAQLHQLRGRVGRGEKQSYCLLFTDNNNEKTLSRLQALETIHNGPRLADLDLRLRGHGDIHGFRQHGIPILALASLTDSKLMNETANAVTLVVQSDSTLSRFPLLSQKVQESTIRDTAQD